MARHTRAFVFLGLVIGAVLTLGACTEDRSRQCAKAYDHLQSLTNGPTSSANRASYVGACRSAWDEGHVRCLLRAKTRDEALACPRQRARPG